MVERAVDDLCGSVLQSRQGHLRGTGGDKKMWTTEAYYCLAILAQHLRSAHHDDVRDVITLCAGVLFPQSLSAQLLGARSPSPFLPPSSRQVHVASFALDVA